MRSLLDCDDRTRGVSSGGARAHVPCSRSGGGGAHVPCSITHRVQRALDHSVAEDLDGRGRAGHVDQNLCEGSVPRLSSATGPVLREIKGSGKKKALPKKKSRVARGARRCRARREEEEEARARASRTGAP